MTRRPHPAPNAITRPQVARVVGVSPQAVEQRIAAGELEAFDHLGTVMVPVRSVRRWIRERAKRFKAQTIAQLGAE